MNPEVLRLEMEENIHDAIKVFEEATKLTVTSIGIDKRFNKDSLIRVFSNVELRV